MEESHLNADCSSNGKSDGEKEEERIKTEGKSKESDVSFFIKWKDPVFKEKFVYSMFMAAAFVALGMHVGQHGPTFLDMQIITNTDLEAASAFFTGGNTGYLTGSIITGLIYNKMSKSFLIFIVTLCMGVCNILIPYCTYYELMIFMRFITAAFAGGIDTGLNSEHMRIWGSAANGLLQFLHFNFSFGGLISPLLAEPFLAEKKDNAVNTTAGNASLLSNNTSDDFVRTDTRVEYVYLITGIFAVLVSIPFLVTYLRHRDGNQVMGNVENRKFSRKNVPFLSLIVMLVGICAFYFLYCSVEDTFFSFIMTFLVEEYKSVSKSRGALTNAIAWASFAVSRFLMIFMTKLFTPVQLLLILSMSMAISFSCFTIFAYLSMVDALTVFSALAGLAMSGCFASGFSWMEMEMFQVTGIISSCILVASSLGSIVNPLILGYLMEEIDNMWFCYILLIDTTVLCLLLIILLIFSRCYVDKKYGTLASSLGLDATIKIDPSNDREEIEPSKNHDMKNDKSDDDVRVGFLQ